VEPRTHRRGDDEARVGDVGEDFFRTPPWPEESEIGEGQRQKALEQRQIVPVVVGHHNRERTGRRRDTRDQFVSGSDDACVRPRKAVRRRHGGTRISHGELPAELQGQPGQGLGVIARSEDR
jgi:hypothetical protein